MTRRLIIAVLLVMTLLSVPFAAPATACARPMRTTLSSNCDCCATMKSCLLPQQNPVRPTATAETAQQAVVMIPPVLHVLQTPAFEVPFRRVDFLIASAPAHSAPRAVLFCTFLI